MGVSQRADILITLVMHCFGSIVNSMAYVHAPRIVTFTTVNEILNCWTSFNNEDWQPWFRWKAETNGDKSLECNYSCMALRKWGFDSGQHWFRWWLVAYSARSHYINQFWAGIETMLISCSGSSPYYPAFMSQQGPIGSEWTRCWFLANPEYLQFWKFPGL